MVANNMDELKIEEATLRRKLDSTRDLSERRQIRALLKTLREKREQAQNDDQPNKNVTSVTKVKTTTSVQRFGNKDVGNTPKAPSPNVRFANVEKPVERTDSGTNMLELRSRRRSVAKPPPSTSFLMNKLSNVMQREKAAQSGGGRPTGVNAFRNKFDTVDANNNRPGNNAPSYKKTVETKTTVSQKSVKGPTTTMTNYSSTVTEKKEEQEISHPNRTALRSRRRSVAKLGVPKHVSEKPNLQGGPGAMEEPPKAKDARFQRRLSRTRMTRTDSKDGQFNALGKPIVNRGGGGGGMAGGVGGGSAADRMAYFRQAAEQEKAKEPVAPVAKPAPKAVMKPAAAPTPQQNKENKTDNVEKPIEKIPRRSPPKKKPQLKRQMSVSQLVLQWCKEQTSEYENVNITNFSGSWADGLAMAALIHKFNPTLFDFNSLIPGDRERNFTTAFQAAEKVGVAVLLDVEDLVRMKKPEPRSIQTQVQMIFSKYRPKDLDTSQLTIA